LKQLETNLKGILGVPRLFLVRINDSLTSTKHIENNQQQKIQRESAKIELKINVNSFQAGEEQEIT